MRSRIASLGALWGRNVLFLGRNLSSSRLASPWRAVLLLGALSALLPSTSKPTYAATEQVLFNFSFFDGAFPNSRLTFDTSGNLYGTTYTGGVGAGSVFELGPAPPSGCPSGTNPGNGWCETLLYSFCSVASCTDGLSPTSSWVAFDSAGNLYGTTSEGGVYNYGTVYELSPEPPSGCPSGTNPGNGWCETVIYSFQGGPTDGANPSGGLVQDSSGNLYGTTVAGTNLGGSVYELSPNGSGGWTESVIYPVDMVNGYGFGLAIDAAGNLYGIDAEEHVFKLSLINDAWTATNIYTFEWGDPSGTPAVGIGGAVLGTTVFGGRGGMGTIWVLTPRQGKKYDGTYGKITLHTFRSPGKGAFPLAGVTLGNYLVDVYCTTSQGGEYSDGTVFYWGQKTPLWSFNGTDGNDPVAALILDSSGNLYGTTFWGGSFNYGTVFEVSP